MTCSACIDTIIVDVPNPGTVWRRCGSFSWLRSSPRRRHWQRDLPAVGVRMQQHYTMSPPKVLKRSDKENKSREYASLTLWTHGSNGGLPN